MLCSLLHLLWYGHSLQCAIESRYVAMGKSVFPDVTELGLRIIMAPHFLFPNVRVPRHIGDLIWLPYFQASCYQD